MAFKNGGEVRLLSRNRLSQNSNYPTVVRAVERLPLEQAILDGEGTWESGAGAGLHVFDVL